MRTDRIALSNFLSHRDTDWSPGGRLVVLTGANGAGKSSLVDALAFALYDDARARGDRLVSAGQSEMAVTVEWEDRQGTFRVIRGRSKGKPYLELAVATLDTGEWVTLTADSVRDTEAKIARIVGLDGAAFRASALLMQGSLDAFVRATPADRKRLLGTILGLEVYAAAESVAKDRRIVAAQDKRAADAILAELARDAAGLPDAESRAKAADEARYQVGAQIAEWDDSVRALTVELADLDAKLDEERGAAEAVSTTRAALVAEAARRVGIAAEIRSLDERRNTVDARLLGADETRATAANLHGLRSLIFALEAYNDSSRRWAERAAVVDLLADQVRRLVPVTCPECGAQFKADPTGVETALADARSLLGDPPESPDGIELPGIVERQRLLAAERAAVLLPALDAASLERDGLEQLLRAKRREELVANAAHAAAVAAAEAAVEEVRAFLTIRTDRTAVAERIERARHDRDETVRRGAHADAAYEAATAEVARLQAVKGRRDQQEMVAAEAEIEVLWVDAIVAAFGVAGIPARIIESVLPELADHARSVLSTLRPSMTLDLSATREKRDGSGTIEALDVTVSDERGPRDIDLLSGGERASVALALAIGLSRLAARRAGQAIRTFVVDEPDGLDLDARRSFGAALRTLAATGDLERIILISHHPDLADYGDESYTVTKGDRGSVVEQT